MARVSSKVFATFLMVGLLGSLPVAAQNLLPELMKVTGVAAGDALNVRTEPVAGSTDIGDLAPDTVVEVLAYSDDEKWAQILWEEGNGWISKNFLTSQRRNVSKGGMPLELSCLGTEPFWGIDLNADETATMSAPEITATAQMQWSSTSANVYRMAYGFIAGPVSGVLRRAECSDGASDRVYGWQLDAIRSDGMLLSGCCTAMQ